VNDRWCLNTYRALALHKTWLIFIRYLRKNNQSTLWSLVICLFWPSTKNSLKASTSPEAKKAKLIFQEGCLSRVIFHQQEWTPYLAKKISSKTQFSTHRQSTDSDVLCNLSLIENKCIICIFTHSTIIHRSTATLFLFFWSILMKRHTLYCEFRSFSARLSFTAVLLMHFMS